MKRILLGSLAVVFAFILYSCSESTVSGSPPVEDSFPNTQGTNWTYKITDSLNNVTRDVTVLVGGKINTSGGEQVTVWQLSFPDSVDSNYVLIRQDTVRILEDKDVPGINIKLVFPLEVGKAWRGDYVTDTSTVTEKTTITLPAGEFKNTYVIERFYGGFNEYNKMTIWFAPNVGIIKMHLRDVGFSFQNEVWELSSYHIN